MDEIKPAQGVVRDVASINTAQDELRVQRQLDEQTRSLIQSGNARISMEKNLLDLYDRGLATQKDLEGVYSRNELAFRGLGSAAKTLHSTMTSYSLPQILQDMGAGLTGLGTIAIGVTGMLLRYVDQARSEVGKMNLTMSAGTGLGATGTGYFGLSQTPGATTAYQMALAGQGYSPKDIGGMYAAQGQSGVTHMQLEAGVKLSVVAMQQYGFSQAQAASLVESTFRRFGMSGDDAATNLIRLKQASLSTGASMPVVADAATRLQDAFKYLGVSADETRKFVTANGAAFQDQKYSAAAFVDSLKSAANQGTTGAAGQYQLMSTYSKSFREGYGGQVDLPHQVDAYIRATQSPIAFMKMQAEATLALGRSINPEGANDVVSDRFAARTVGGVFKMPGDLAQSENLLTAVRSGTYDLETKKIREGNAITTTMDALSTALADARKSGMGVGEVAESLLNAHKIGLMGQDPASQKTQGLIGLASDPLLLNPSSREELNKIQGDLVKAVKTLSTDMTKSVVEEVTQALRSWKKRK